MSQRNRSTLAALVLVAALALPIAHPATAAGLHPDPTPALTALERAWTWLAGLLLPDVAALQVAAHWEKEGGAIDPNGSSTPSASPSTTAQVSGAPTLDGTK